MPKISIITTTYKHEKFIAAMIDSVLSQSFTDWELLIGDDNSPDNTYCIIQEYTKKDPRIKSWKQEKNTGIVGNMNFILSKVNTESEYVTFLEGDDMYSPENLMEKFRIFRKYDNIDFFWSDWHKMDAEDNITPRKTHRTEGIYNYPLGKFLTLTNPIQSFGAVAFRSPLLEKILPIQTPDGNQEGMFGPLDYLLWTKLLPGIDIYYSEKPLFLYRIHSNNFVRNVAIMNAQLEMIYSNIIKTVSDVKIQKTCYKYIRSNHVVSAFFEHDRRSTWAAGYERLKLGLDIRTILLMGVVCFPRRFVDTLLLLYRSQK